MILNRIIEYYQIRKRKKAENKFIKKQVEESIKGKMSNGDGSFIPDLSRIFFRPGFAFTNKIIGHQEYIAIGWIGNFVPNLGRLDSSLLEALKHFHKYHWVDEGWLGYHTCQICNSFDDRGEFLIETGSSQYMLPKMILHYIEAHNYLPPSKFLDDLAEYWELGDCKSNSCKAIKCFQMES